MSEISSGYTRPNCRSVGGVLKLIIYNLENRASYTRLANAITAITMSSGKQAYQFLVENETANAQNVGTGSRPDFTFFYAQAITAILTDKTQANIDLLADLNPCRLGVIVFYENGLNRHFGVINGMMVDTDTDDSGTEYGNRNGDEIVMSGKEVLTAPTISTALAEALLIAAS